ncbi:MAG: hypothetical protein MZU95_03940 [Desulfomicrobium escambiense]|nr:hypothetical protein [Desulfomicrobium escambiense]
MIGENRAHAGAADPQGAQSQHTSPHAGVIARGATTVSSILLLLDKGSRSGIRKKTWRVVTAKGLAGRIHAVSDNYSEMLLLWDPELLRRRPVRGQQAGRRGLGNGTGVMRPEIPLA